MKTGMRVGMMVLVAIAAFAATGCSSGSMGDSAGDGGAQVGLGCGPRPGDPPGDLSGLYKTTIGRSVTNPGTCSDEYVYNSSVNFGVGSGTYVNGVAGPPWMLAESVEGVGTVPCMTSTSECTFTATCANSMIDRVTLTISGRQVVGTIARTTTSGCTANFDIMGQKF